jgi:sn1-specific diacylglycerol lipase
LNELAVDLTCEPMEFNPAQTPPPMEEESSNMPGYVQFPSPSARSMPSAEEAHSYHVHGGMLRMSRVMGGVDKPLHRAVRDALRKHPRYGKITLFFRILATKRML